MDKKIIDYPFSFSRSANGQYINILGATNDDRKIWQHRILLVLGTRPGERLMRPNFGSNLYKSLFETESIAAEVAREAIGTAFSQWLTDLDLREINISFDKTTNTLTANIIYRLPNGEPDSVTINTGIFNRSGELIQEITNG